MPYAPLLDMSGQEGYWSLRDQRIRDGESFLLIYSIDSRASFTKIPKFHEQTILDIMGNFVRWSSEDEALLISLKSERPHDSWEGIAEDFRKDAACKTRTAISLRRKYQSLRGSGSHRYQARPRAPKPSPAPGLNSNIKEARSQGSWLFLLVFYSRLTRLQE